MAEETKPAPKPKKAKKIKAYKPGRSCPKCGSRMGEHANRVTCGKCGYTELMKEQKVDNSGKKT